MTDGGSISAISHPSSAIHHHMTFYHQQVLQLTRSLYPNDDLSAQVIQGKEFIEKRFASNIALADIAGEAFISKYHFIRLFRSFYGQTPYQYLMMIRIRKAKELLKEGNTVSDTCFSVGFSSTTSFTGLFKKMTGFTPSQLKIATLKS